MEKKSKSDYWLFTVISEYKSMFNLWFDEFPTDFELRDECAKTFAGHFTIVSITQLTPEQYEKLSGKEVKR